MTIPSTPEQRDEAATRHARGGRAATTLRLALDAAIGDDLVEYQVYAAEPDHVVVRLRTTDAYLAAVRISATYERGRRPLGEATRDLNAELRAEGLPFANDPPPTIRDWAEAHQAFRAAQGRTANPNVLTDLNWLRQHLGLAPRAAERRLPPPTTYPEASDAEELDNYDRRRAALAQRETGWRKGW